MSQMQMGYVPPDEGSSKAVCGSCCTIQNTYSDYCGVSWIKQHRLQDGSFCPGGSKFPNLNVSLVGLLVSKRLEGESHE